MFRILIGFAFFVNCLTLAGCFSTKPNTAITTQHIKKKQSTQIENDFYLVEVDAGNGAIKRIFDKIGGLELISEPRLADNFRICLPLPDRPQTSIPDETKRFITGTQANYILGRDQRLSSSEKIPNGVKLHWGGPLKNEQGDEFDLSALMTIEWVGQSIAFRFNVYNNTPYKMYEVWYPIVGGVTGVGERVDTRVHIPTTKGEFNPNMFHKFQASWFEFGSPVPEILIAYAENPTQIAGMSLSHCISKPFIDIYNKKLNRGMYFGMHANGPKGKVLRIELQPGLGHMRDPDTNWPRPEEIDERFPVGLIFEWIHFVDTGQPGDGFVGGPVVIQCHEGDWDQAARLFENRPE